MTKWFKCPRCIRYTVLFKPRQNRYHCQECLKSFTKNKFEALSKKEFGQKEFESE